MTVAAMFCLIVALLAGGLFLLELAFRLLPYALATVGWTLEIVLWLASAGIVGWRAVRRLTSPWFAHRASDWRAAA